MLQRPLFLFALAGCSLAQAAAPEPLARRLKELSASTAISAEVSLGAPGAEQETTVIVHETERGLAIEWPSTLIKTYTQSLSEGPKKNKAGALDRARPSALHGYLHASAELQRHLEDAELLGESALSEEGRSLRQFRFKLDPHLDEEAKKYVKEIHLELELVTGSDYTPVRAVVTTRAKGRAFVVISFGQEATETYLFQNAAGRLVTLRHEKQSKATGTGGDREEKSLTVVRLLPSPT